MFFVEASRTMTTVRVPVYLRELGADVRLIGLFFTLSLDFPLLLRIFGGWISDSIGRLRAMLIGGIAGVLTTVAYAASRSWETALLAPGPAPSREAPGGEAPGARKPHGPLGTTACLRPLAGSSWLSQAACSLALVCSGLASSPIRGLGTWGSS